MRNLSRFCIFIFTAFFIALPAFTQGANAENAARNARRAMDFERFTYEISNKSKNSVRPPFRSDISVVPFKYSSTVSPFVGYDVFSEQIEAAQKGFAAKSAREQVPANAKEGFVAAEKVGSAAKATMRKEPPSHVAERRILTTAEKTTLEQVNKFVQETKRFPEQHSDEEIEASAAAGNVDFAAESVLREKIDDLVTKRPHSDFTKEIFDLYSQYAEQQILTIEQVLEQISPDMLETLSAPVGQVKMFPKPPLIASSELPNAYKLTDNLYRGGQPTEDGYKMLSRMGIKTVISFRTHKPNKELIESLGMQSVHIPLNPAFITPSQMTQFLQLVADPAHKPVYVHCHYGSDRTGAMIAAYRIVIQKWPRRDALAEMRNPDFSFHRAFFTLPAELQWIDFSKVEIENNLQNN